MDKATIAEIQKKVRGEMLERESRLLAYWLGELEKISNRRHESMAALQTEIRNLMERMNNRMRILRKEADR